MNLLIDIGNSRIKWGITSAEDADEISGTACFERNKENPQALLNNFSDSWLEHKSESKRSNDIPSEILVSCVANDAVFEQLAEWTQSTWGIKPERLQVTHHACGVKNSYDVPTDLGADRWAALIAAHRFYRENVLIIDCGTAVTLDVLTSDGQHQGGYIIPGLTLMRKALSTGTHALPEVLGQKIELADNTHDAIAGGTLTSIVATIERTFNIAAEQLGQPLNCVMTGGDAEKIMPLLTIPVHYEPQFILKGLLVMLNSKKD